MLGQNAPNSTCARDAGLEGACEGAVLPSRGTVTGWRNGLTGFCGVIRGNRQLLPLGRNHPRHQDRLEASSMKSSSAERALGELNEPAMCCSTAKGSSSIVCCIRKLSAG